MGICDSTNNPTQVKKPVHNVNNQVITINREAIYYTAKGELPNELLENQSLSKLIELFVFTKNTLPLNYEISLSEGIDNNSKFLGTSSSTGIGSKEFNSSFKLMYFFEKTQNMLVNLKSEKGNSQLNFTLGKLMGSRGQKIELPLTNQQGSLVFQAESIKNEQFNSEILITACAIASYTDVYFFIKKDISDNTETRFANVYKSEVIPNLSNYNFAFNQIKLISSALKSHTNNVIIEFYSSNNKIADFSFKLNEVDQENNLNLKLTSQNVQLELRIVQKKIHKFVDYLRGGTQISLIIGIDFTASNNPYEQPKSLHYLGNNMNQYEQAILSCGSIVAYYDYDQLFPVFGYGASLSPHSDVSHCFNINFQPDPNIFTIQNVLNGYRECLRKIRFSGPTLFEPIIRRSIEVCKSNLNNNIYYILMILTDGQIGDMGETINALVDASFFPISLIIIGIGDADFSNMDTLDADTTPLVSSNNIKAKRDFVQFVEFRKHQNNPEKLSSEVLAEIPSQVVGYYSMMNMEPNIPINLN